MVAQEKGEIFELVTSASLDVVPSRLNDTFEKKYYLQKFGWFIKFWEVFLKPKNWEIFVQNKRKILNIYIYKRWQFKKEKKMKILPNTLKKASLLVSFSFFFLIYFPFAL